MSSTTPTTWPKLHKALAQAGLGSRLSMEAAIEQGRVKVGGQRATIGQRLSPGDKVLLDGKPVQVSCNAPSIRVLAYHKPVGEVVTHDDPENRPTVFGRLPRLTASKWLAIGRLDINTEGLLLITNSGDLANRLMHPSFGLDREYAVRVLGALTDEEKQRLLEGVAIDAGRPACFSSIVDETGDSDASEGGVNRWYRVVIAEGRNREVRRMIEAVGHVVSRLIRIRYGSFALPKGLKRGDWIELDIKTIRDLGESVGAPAAIFGRGAAAGQRPARQKLSRGDRGRGAGPRPDMSNPKHSLYIGERFSNEPLSDQHPDRSRTGLRGRSARPQTPSLTQKLGSQTAPYAKRQKTATLARPRSNKQQTNR